MNLKTFDLAYKFINLSRDEFIRHCSKKWGLSSAKSYDKALHKLGFESLMPNAPTGHLGAYYVATLVESQVPISPLELRILKSYEDYRSLIRVEPILKRDGIVTGLGTDISSDIDMRLHYIGKQLALHFSLTETYREIKKGNLVGYERMIESIMGFVNSKANIKFEDTTVVTCSKSGTSKKINVYLPTYLKDTIDPVYYLAVCICTEITAPKTEGYLDNQMVTTLSNTLGDIGNIYMFPKDASSTFLLYELDTLTHMYNVGNIYTLISPNLQAGTHIGEINCTNPHIICGNIDRTVNIITSKGTLILDTKKYPIIEKYLKESTLSKIQDVLHFVDEQGDNKSFWNFLYGNGVPRDGNYNNLTSSNIL